MPKKPLPDHFLSEMQTFARELETESERGSIILAASMLEEALGLLLKTSLHGNVSEDLKRELFFGQGAMASFSSRIKLCYGLGHISENEFKALNVIREIRNSFAHFGKPSPSLGDQKYTARMDNITGLFPIEYDAAPRMRFVQFCSALTITLTHMRLGMIHPAKQHPELPWEFRTIVFGDDAEEG